MPTTAPKTSFAPLNDLDAVSEHARQTTDRLADVGRKVTNAYLDGLEKYVAGYVELERKLGKQSHVEAFASVLDTHAQMTEEAFKAGVSAARELITA